MWLFSWLCSPWVCPGGSEGKESACNAGDLGLIPGSGRSPGEGNGNPLQYSCICVLICFSPVWLFATLWSVAHQAPLSMRFSRQEYWSGLPFLSSGDLPDPGIKPRSPALWADSLPPEPPGKPYVYNIVSVSAIKQSEAVRHTHTHTHTHTDIYISVLL